MATLKLTLDPGSLQQLLLPLQQQLDDHQQRINERFDRLEQHFIAHQSNTVDGSKSPGSTIESNDRASMKDAAFQEHINDRFDRNEQQTSARQPSNVDEPKFTGSLSDSDNGSTTKDNAHQTAMSVDESTKDREIYFIDTHSEGTASLESPKTPTFTMPTEVQIETPSNDPRLSQSANESELTTSDSKLAKLAIFDVLAELGTEITRKDPEARLPVAASQAPLYTSESSKDLDSAMSTQIEAEASSSNTVPSSSMGGSELTSCNSPSEDPMLPQNRPEKEEFCHGSPYCALVHGSSHAFETQNLPVKCEDTTTLANTGGQDTISAVDTASSDSSKPSSSMGGSELTSCDSPSEDPMLPQNRPEKDEFCYGFSSSPLVHGNSQALETETPVEKIEDDTTPANAEGQDNMHAVNIASDEPNTNCALDTTEASMDNVEPALPAGNTQSHDPTMPQNRPDKDDSYYRPSYRALFANDNSFPEAEVPNVTPAIDDRDTEIPHDIKSAGEQGQSAIQQDDIDPGSSAGEGNSKEDDTTTPTSTTETVELCPQDGQLMDWSNGEESSNDIQQSHTSVENQALLQSSQPWQPSPKGQDFDSLITDLEVILCDPKLSTLPMIKDLVVALFSHGKQPASEVFQAIDTAVTCHKPSAEGKIDVHAIKDAGDGFIQWDSPINAAMLPLLLGTKTSFDPDTELDTSTTDALEALVEDVLGTIPKDILHKTRSQPSASLATAFRAAKKDAQAHGKTTLLSVRLVDTHFLELIQKRGPITEECYTSFAHNFVLGLGPTGCVLWQAWGDGQAVRDRSQASSSTIPGAYGLDDWIKNGEADLRDWKVMEEWVDAFEKLVKLKGSMWTNRHNKLYKRCFGPDLTRSCFPQGSLVGMTPKIKAWVGIEALNDVKVEDVGKLVFCA